MKIALCLSGYFENAGGVHASLRGHEYLKKKLLNEHDVDIFIHSWDLKNELLIRKIYPAKSIVFEEQRSFSEVVNNIDQKWFFGEDNQAPGMYSGNNVFKGLSVSYSRMRSVELKYEYEKDNSFVYDCVIMARFDLGQRGKEHYQKYYATNFNFDPTLDMDYLYSVFWDQLNHGFGDHWFYSSSENMDIVAGLHEKIVEYYQPDSQYVNAVLNGWPDSNLHNQFSNEMLKDDSKSDNLITWDRWACIDNHKIYKWHFINTGLYEKCKFVDCTRDM